MDPLNFRFDLIMTLIVSLKLGIFPERVSGFLGTFLGFFLGIFLGILLCYISLAFSGFFFSFCMGIFWVFPGVFFGIFFLGICRGVSFRYFFKLSTRRPKIIRKKTSNR